MPFGHKNANPGRKTREISLEKRLKLMFWQQPNQTANCFIIIPFFLVHIRNFESSSSEEGGKKRNFFIGTNDNSRLFGVLLLLEPKYVVLKINCEYLMKSLNLFQLDRYSCKLEMLDTCSQHPHSTLKRTKETHVEIDTKTKGKGKKNYRKKTTFSFFFLKRI